MAGRVLCRVLGHFPHRLAATQFRDYFLSFLCRRQLLVDCGFTALTQQGKGNQQHPQMIGRLEGEPGLMLSKMTQEIGFVEPVDQAGEIGE